MATINVAMAADIHKLTDEALISEHESEVSAVGGDVSPFFVGLFVGGVTSHGGVWSGQSESLFRQHSGLPLFT